MSEDLSSTKFLRREMRLKELAVSEKDTNIESNGNIFSKFIARKRFLIYPKFQLQLVGFNIFIVTLGFAGVTWGLAHFFGQLHERGVDSGLGMDHYYFIFLDNESHQLYMLIGAAYALSILITSGFTIFLSQKIAGPIVRMQSYFTSEKLQQSPPLEFRKGDFFEELPAAINKALRK